MDDEAGERLWKHRDVVALMVQEAKAVRATTVVAVGAVGEGVAFESTASV